MKSRAAVFILFFLAGCVAFSAEEVKTLQLPAAGIDTLEINSGAGFLKVQGVEGLTSIEATGEIYVRGVSKEDMPKFISDHVKFTMTKKDGRAVLVSEVKEPSIFSFRDARIDLTVKMPTSLSLTVDDGSGSVEIGRVGGNMSIEDGSGSIMVENVKGNLKIEDGSGGIEVRDIGGDVSIEDGSGSISVVNVKGSVTIDDGSGSITIDGVEKDLILKDTGSGGLNINNVKGRVVK
jgi:hypothetical protein